MLYIIMIFLNFLGMLLTYTSFFFIINFTGMRMHVIVLLYCYTCFLDFKYFPFKMF